MYPEMTELIGKTFTDVNVGDYEVQFLGDRSYRLFHEQDCCESVWVHDVNGDPKDLVGTPIVQAAEISSEDTPEPGPLDPYDTSFTWTFYRISTIKGTVVIRFYGTSNGYYSERARLGLIGNY